MKRLSVYKGLDKTKHVKQLEGKNIHSVYTRCYECKMWGVNFPNDDICANCSGTDTMTYYDAETVQKAIKESKSKAIEDFILELRKWTDLYSASTLYASDLLEYAEELKEKI